MSMQATIAIGYGCTYNPRLRDPEVFEIPFLPCDAFHGREDLLRGMEEYFHNSTLRSPKQLRYAICGLAVVVENWEFELVAYFRQRRRLELSVDLEVFPDSAMGSYIITSHDPAAIGSAREGGSQVDPLKPEEAIAVLFEKIGIKTPTEGDYEQARAIVEMLGCLPLAMDHCSAYIRTRQKTLSEYHRLYQEQRDEVLGYKHQLSENNKPVLKAWEVNFRQIERDSKKAYILLLIFCFLDAAHIFEAMLSRACMPERRWDRHGELIEAAVEDSDLDRELVALIKNEVEFDTAIEKLLSFSLIYRNKNVDGLRSFSLHPLVQYCASQRVDLAVQTKWRLQAILLVCRAFPRYSYPEPLYGDLGRSQIRHVHRIVKEYDILQKHSQIPTSVRSELCSTLISASLFSGTMWKLEAIDRAKALLASDLDFYIHARAALRESSLLRLVGDKAGSNKTLEEFIHSTVLPGHGKEADSDARWNAYRGDLVVSYAENLIQTCELARARSELCEWGPIVPEHPSTMEQLVLRTRDASLGRILRFEGRFAEALALFKGILEQSQEDDLYKESSWYPVIVSNIADMHCELGQPDVARNVAELALAQLTLRGWQNISYGRRLQLALIETLILSGSYSEAEEYLHRLVRIHKAIVKPTLPCRTSHFRVWADLARISHLNKRWDEALTRWRQALARLEEYRKGESFLGGVVWHSIAHCLAEMGEKKQSEEALEKTRGWLAGGREFWDLGFGTYWYDFVMGALGENIKEMQELKI